MTEREAAAREACGAGLHDGTDERGPIITGPITANRCRCAAILAALEAEAKKAWHEGYEAGYIAGNAFDDDD